jgi:ribonucleoside-diphosphate reductase alpha chain
MQKLQQIKKRNGDVVSFDENKIALAVEKAFLSQNIPGAKEVSVLIASQVKGELEERFGSGDRGLPSVEQTQDLVEKYLMEGDHFEAAKAYILYRYQRAQVRAEEKQENLEKLEEGGLSITKRDGDKELFSEVKLKKSLTYAITGFEDIVNVDAIVSQVKLEVYEGIQSREIDKALVMVTRSLIEQDPAYSYISARLLLRQIYEEVMGENLDWKNFEAGYQKSFVDNIKLLVSEKKLDERMLSFDLERLAQALDIKRDGDFLYLGIATLHDRYFIKSDTKKAYAELPQAFWMRVAMGLAFLEKDKEAAAIDFYRMMSTLRFVPSTPTLFHAGTTHPQLSSCYLNTVGDSLESIFKIYGDNAQMSKYAGGIGTDWSAIRGTGAIVKKTGIDSQGVIPFLKIANDVTVAINRSGRRRGATAAYLENWHYDFEDFLELRKNTGDERRRTHDMNTVSWISDLFMARVKEDGEWMLISPDEAPDLHELFGEAFAEKYKEYEAKADRGDIRLFKKLKARDLWKKMITMLYETGHPWITFKDPSNIRSPQDHAGVVHNSNLCTEITLNNSLDETAVCNLGSVNLPKHIENGKFSPEKIAETVKVGMRMLDNVIDVNYYPTEEAKNSNMRHRPVGLGIMGFHDALYMLDIIFDSEEAVRFADESMEVVSYAAIMSSSLLAKERGAYGSYKGSKWDRGIFPIDTVALLEKSRNTSTNVLLTSKLNWAPVRDHVKAYGMRNSNTMAIAPTATISNIAGSIPSIEPIYKNIYVKSNISGDFTVINPYLVEDLKKSGLWDFEMIGEIKFGDGSLKNISRIPAHIKDKYKETFEIAPQWLIKAAAYRGKWIDQAQSLNIFYSGSSGRELSEIYTYAWDMGLKTTYYLRSLGASQVEKSTVNAVEYGSTHKRGGEKGEASTYSMPSMAASAPENLPHGAPAPQELTTAQKMAAEALLAKKEGVGANAPKLCSILDPECEACQ